MTPAELREIARRLRALEDGRCSRRDWEVFSVTAFRDLRALVVYALNLEEALEEAAHRLESMTPAQFDGQQTDELQPLESVDLLAEDPDAEG